ncbi:MAG: hypothetical protein AABW51_03375 [Nanoarchaeota archaeon]
MINTKYTKIGLLFLFGILAISYASASGVVTPYWASDPLTMTPGESKTVALTLQNMVGNEDITLIANLTNNAGVATLIDKNLNYFVPFGKDDVPVNVKIDIPSNAKAGDSYTVTVSFQQIASGSGQMVQVASGFTTNIPIVVISQGVNTSATPKEQPKETTNTAIWLIIAILIVVIIIFFLVMKAKKQVKKQSQ